MPIDKTGSNQPLSEIKSTQFTQTIDTIKEKLANLPEKLNGVVQGRSIATFFSTTFASIEKKMNSAVSEWKNFLPQLELNSLKNITAKILTDIPRKFQSIQSSIMPSPASHKTLLQKEAFTLSIMDLETATVAYANALLLKSSDIKLKEETLKGKLELAKTYTSKDPSDLPKMNKAIQMASVFTTSLNPTRTATNWKASKPDLIMKDILSLNTALFGESPLSKAPSSETKTDLQRKEGWIESHRLIGIRDKNYTPNLQLLNNKLNELVDLRESLYPTFSPFIKFVNNTFVTMIPSVPKPAEPKTPEEIAKAKTPEQIEKTKLADQAAKAKIAEQKDNAQKEIKGAIDQIKQKIAELDQITFPADGDPETLRMANFSKTYILNNYQILLRNLQGIEKELIKSNG